jgi:hypothetical protein
VWRQSAHGYLLKKQCDVCGYAAIEKIENLAKSFELIEATCSTYIHILVDESRF